MSAHVFIHRVCNRRGPKRKFRPYYAWIKHFVVKITVVCLDAMASWTLRGFLDALSTVCQKVCQSPFYTEIKDSVSSNLSLTSRNVTLKLNFEQLRNKIKGYKENFYHKTFLFWGQIKNNAFEMVPKTCLFPRAGRRKNKLSTLWVEHGRNDSASDAWLTGCPRKIDTIYQSKNALYC